MCVTEAFPAGGAHHPEFARFAQWGMNAALVWGAVLVVLVAWLLTRTSADWPRVRASVGASPLVVES